MWLPPGNMYALDSVPSHEFPLIWILDLMEPGSHSEDRSFFLGGGGWLFLLPPLFEPSTIKSDSFLRIAHISAADASVLALRFKILCVFQKPFQLWDIFCSFCWFWAKGSAVNLSWLSLWVAESGRHIRKESFVGNTAITLMWCCTL